MKKEYKRGNILESNVGGNNIKEILNDIINEKEESGLNILTSILIDTFKMWIKFK